MLPTKTPTDSLTGRRVIALADADNLAISFERIHGRKLDTAALRLRLSRATSKLTAAAVLTTQPGLNYTTTEWERGGWQVTAILRETAITCRGAEHLANGDLDLAFEAGALISTHPHADTLLLLTGDGTLATSIARDTHRRRPNMGVIACAVPGAASARLRDSRDFDSYFDLGSDVTAEASLLFA